MFRATRGKNSRPLRGLYIWPLHSLGPSDALGDAGVQGHDFVEVGVLVHPEVVGVQSIAELPEREGIVGSWVPPDPCGKDTGNADVSCHFRTISHS